LGIPLGTLPWQHKQNLFVVLPFQNELEYRNANGQIHNALNVATLCTKLVMFGAVTPEKRLLYIFCTFVKKKYKNGHIRLITSEHARPILTNFSAMIDI